jgi:hypothetical protein
LKGFTALTPKHLPHDRAGQLLSQLFRRLEFVLESVWMTLRQTKRKPSKEKCLGKVITETYIASRCTFMFKIMKHRKLTFYGVTILGRGKMVCLVGGDGK